MTVYDSADVTGLACQAVFQYVKLSDQREKINLVNIYGNRGSPMQVYRWNDE